MASALRTALRPEQLGEGQVRSLLHAATQTADRRRYLRRVTAPALLLAGAAAAVVCVFGLALLPRSGPTANPPATGQVPAAAAEDQRRAFLTLAEVQTVIQEAGYSMGREKYWPTPPGEPLWAACGPDALTGLTPPATVERGRWASWAPAAPTPDGALQDVGDTAVPAAPGEMTAVVATFTSAEQATDYTRAFQASVDACAAAGMVPLYLAVAPTGDVASTAPPPPGPDRQGMDVFSRVWDLQDGRWLITSVVVRDQVAVRLDAVVSAGSGEAAGSAFQARVTGVENLAVLAADRAAAS